MKKIKLLAMASLMAVSMATPCIAATETQDVLVNGSVTAIEQEPLLDQNRQYRYRVVFSIYDVYGYDCETNSYVSNESYTYDELVKNGYLTFPDVILEMTDNANGIAEDEDIITVYNILSKEEVIR